MRPTYEELEAKLAKTEFKLAETESKLTELQVLFQLALKRISELEEKINKNSNNSSKPPSTDQKANTSKNKDKKDRKNRNKGVSRSKIPLERVNHFVTCSLAECPFCASQKLKDLNSPLKLQQVELPEVHAIVTEYSRTKHKCESCQKISFGDLPEGVPSSAFGPRLMGLLSTLTGVFHLSKREAKQLIKDLYGVEICEGSVVNIEERVTEALLEVYERIHKHVMQSGFTKHFDETSWRNNGKTCFVWIGSTAEATCLHIDPNRSKEAFKRFTGSLGKAPIVTDRFGVYNNIENPHQYCLAHLIRDFRNYAERKCSDGEIGRKIEAALQEICRIQRRFREGEISKRSRGSHFGHLKKRLEDYLLEGFIDGSEKLQNLCDRLLEKFSNLWTFSEFIDVDPTNNLAERDLRRIVLWRKKSYGTRSKKGQTFVERVSSVAQTAKKAGKNILKCITEVIQSFYRKEPAPMLNEILGF